VDYGNGGQRAATSAAENESTQTTADDENVTTTNAVRTAHQHNIGHSVP